MQGRLNSDYHTLQGIAMPFVANDREFSPCPQSQYICFWFRWQGKIGKYSALKKACLALVIFLHCILFMQYCHQQQHGVDHELNRQMKCMELLCYCKWLQILLTEIDLETGKLSATKSWNNFWLRKYTFHASILKIEQPKTQVQEPGEHASKQFWQTRKTESFWQSTSTITQSMRLSKSPVNAI